MKLSIKIVIALCFSSNFLFAQTKPELFVLSVGVSKYQNPKYNLSFADKDAIDLAEAFKKQTDLFDIRKISTLTNEKATRTNIRNELSALKKAITANDLFVFIFSGHGLNEALVTHDFNIKDRTATSLNKSDLIELIGQFNCNYIILIDACHSGSFAKGIDLAGKDINSDFIREQNIANENLLRALNATDKANIVIGSSSSSEKSDECKDCQNGYFTQCILDAFEGKPIKDPETSKTYSPDKDRNGFVYTNELDDYLKEAVSIMTRDNAIPQSVISKQSPGFNFPLVKFKDSDGDGFPDTIDECEGIKGSAMGCPDGDNDGVADKNDKCPNIKGVSELAGCPQPNQAGNLQLSVKKTTNRVSKSSAISKSIAFPGWGDKTLNPDSKRTWMGGLGYSTIVGGLFLQLSSKKAFDNYNKSTNSTDIDAYRSKTIKYNNFSKILFGASVAIWTYDLISVASSKNAKIAVSENGIGVNISF
jgi:Caspase domain